MLRLSMASDAGTMLRKNMASRVYTILGLQSSTASRKASLSTTEKESLHRGQKSAQKILHTVTAHNAVIDTFERNLLKFQHILERQSGGPLSIGGKFAGEAIPESVMSAQGDILSNLA